MMIAKGQRSGVRDQGSEKPPFPNPLSEKEMERLSEFFNEGAVRVEEKPEHWISGYDGSISFCRECMDKKIDALRKENPKIEYQWDGGWMTEGDSIAYCETCGCRLCNSLTREGCESELDHYEDNGFGMSDSECADLENVISSCGWMPWLDRSFRNDSAKEDEINYFARLHKLGRSILIKLDQKLTTGGAQ